MIHETGTGRPVGAIADLDLLLRNAMVRRIDTPHPGSAIRTAASWNRYRDRVNCVRDGLVLPVFCSLTRPDKHPLRPFAVRGAAHPGCCHNLFAHQALAEAF